MFLLIFIILIVAKSNSYLLGYQILNPDELQMMSNAIGLTSKGLNFINFDGTTSGIYNSLILAWPEIVNLEITDVCNERCVYCYNFDRNFSMGTISLDKVKIDELVRQFINHEVFHVVASGGEAFANFDMSPVCDEV